MAASASTAAQPATRKPGRYRLPKAKVLAALEALRTTGVAVLENWASAEHCEAVRGACLAAQLEWKHDPVFSHEMVGPPRGFGWVGGNSSQGAAGRTTIAGGEDARFVAHWTRLEAFRLQLVAQGLGAFISGARTTGGLVLAHYKRGAAYGRHHDSPRLGDSVTAIYYPLTCAGDGGDDGGGGGGGGGELRLLPYGCELGAGAPASDAEAAAQGVAVPVVAGSLVLFDSHLQHEVLEVRCEDRLALTSMFSAV